MKNSRAFLYQVCFTSSVVHTLLNANGAAALVGARRTRRLRRTHSFPPSFSCRAPRVGTKIPTPGKFNSTGSVCRRARSQYLLSGRIYRQKSGSCPRNNTRQGAASSATGTVTSAPFSTHPSSPAGKERPCTPPNQTMPRTAAGASSIDKVLLAKEGTPWKTPAGETAGMNADENSSSYELQQYSAGTIPSRSASTAARNRLSLTLPIMLPDGVSSRPTPVSSAHASFPTTPAEAVSSSSLTSPADPADLIQAIAAQERRVLELKEELKHAEHELKKLRKQFVQADKHGRKSHSRHNITSPVGVSDANSSDDTLAQRRTIELDRRRAILAVQQQQSHQTEGKKRVFRGHHTRALSLISPTKSASASEVETDEQDSVSASSAATGPSRAPERSSLHDRNRSMLSKRATWAMDTRQSASGIKQFADDFRTGLWTFVEDIRQVTVGDEAIDRQQHPRPGSNDVAPDPARSTAIEPDGGNTIQPPAPARPATSSLDAEEKQPPLQKSSTNNNIAGPRVTRQDSKSKRFSWTPLTEDLNEEDWSNWDSPTVGAPSTRWSGSTAGSNAENSSVEMEETPSKLSTSRNSLQFLQGTGLEEIPWTAAIHKLSPSNIKRTANTLMDQWEKSLASPGSTNANGNGNDTAKDKASASPASAQISTFAHPSEAAT